jgi:hypothetical protein
LSSPAKRSAGPAARRGLALADKLVLKAELSVAAGAKLAGLPYARYLQHLGALGYSMLDEAGDIDAELALLQGRLPPDQSDNPTTSSQPKR